ncbi:hypothetical protein MCOR27_006900 [Pyricularia oryzae]|uniref:Mitochondrial import inner membrane translocase subunit n=4 Tax=Pyricularia TaxID=48558 RepID=A0ABQ8NTY5_PYRGI|nr:hypothetical protein PpBr36_00468 [Pyricularia pennisetigena]KAH8837266.1 hypothetical protein MCOR01_010901 [Pyricularia oryzae]KAI6302001.1 hypothetical protein MCOR33_002623 [Pyricularia grisea]KAH9438065.1 hypothetical protein MCOR02_001706 [Pyricularia oryzae]KAI6255063.1 hypothetical protein MCOR19_008453 [Pyricularia oryzae]KAI6268589.1 hypothetical protein MCOR26_009135 [Pyricularia oryzae]
MDASDVEKLQPKDKAELLQFVNNEQQRTKVQSQTHNLTEVCWKKCVTSIKGNGLEKSEEQCLASCVDRFLDVNLATMQHLSTLRR